MIPIVLIDEPAVILHKPVSLGSPVKPGRSDRGRSGSPLVNFDVSRLGSMINANLGSTDRDENYIASVDPESRTTISRSPRGIEGDGEIYPTVSLCTVNSWPNSRGSLRYFMLDYEIPNQLRIKGVAKSGYDGYIKLVTASLGKTDLCFFRELAPIDSSADIIGKTQPVKLTGFATGNIAINADSRNLTYGIGSIRTKVNPNEYEIRARITSKPRRDFYLDEALYSFSVEINDQGNKFRIPIVITDTMAQQCKINPATDIAPGKNIHCNISLQGRF